MNDSLCGILCLNKPTGFTSFDAVAKLRGILKQKRIGHTGTLDPMAEGVLPMLIGRASLACDILPDTDKSYKAGFKLGITTDTQDISGKVTEKREYSPISHERIVSAIEGFKGEILQVPPMYSAVSVNGKRLYELARQNIAVDRPPRRVRVSFIDVTSYDSETGEGTLEISCSKGTYIRTIINDLGEALGTGAVMTSLVRTKACGFSIKDCVTFEELENSVDPSGYIIPVETLFKKLPAVYLTPDEERLYRCGIRLDTKRTDCSAPKGRAGVYGGNFIGTAQISADKGGVIIPEKTFVLAPSLSYKGGYAVALGVFDGVHAGHRRVIECAVEIARELELQPAVFTFISETMHGGGKELSDTCLTDEDEKKARLLSCGVKYIYTPPFDELKNLSAEEFVKRLLKNRMKAGAVICGEDFRCGRDAACDCEQLGRLCAEYGIAFRSVKPVTDKNGNKISSGKIRELVKNGEVSEAAELMGEYYSFTSRILGGNRLGRTLGFPTINQKIPGCMILPKYGVYAARVTVGGKTYNGLANIGVKPTVSDKGEVLCETYIFGFDGDVYGCAVRTSLTDFIRSERKFSSEQELKAQVLSDIADAKSKLS